ncbi:hypothetical protein BJF90_16555 [Pseudonocardia sp. CNS-004]|nr:hypothetical protein BJF90_16555 [Pseudonocardia sp. CNS-004]
MELTATVAGAMLPGEQPPGQDRWAVAQSSVVVLDGATAVDPDVPPADVYVTDLCTVLTALLGDGADARRALRESITTVARRLDLTAGRGPSSTATILRSTGDLVEVAALGDSTAVVGLRGGRIERITDERLSRIAPDLRQQYQRRLRAGHGFDSTHRTLLRQVQRAERAVRNSPGGYWIAEADPAAADHAIVRRYPADQVEWCVLATDGAQRPFEYLHGIWSDLPADAGQVRSHLERLQMWEATGDPDGYLLPRSKRHDDKTIVVWRP